MHSDMLCMLPSSASIGPEHQPTCLAADAKTQSGCSSSQYSDKQTVRRRPPLSGMHAQHAGTRVQAALESSTLRSALSIMVSHQTLPACMAAGCRGPVRYCQVECGRRLLGRLALPAARVRRRHRRRVVRHRLLRMQLSAVLVRPFFSRRRLRVRRGRVNRHRWKGARLLRPLRPPASAALPCPPQHAIKPRKLCVRLCVLPALRRPGSLCSQCPTTCQDAVSATATASASAACGTTAFAEAEATAIGVCGETHGN